jgi:hypothetical protein
MSEPSDNTNDRLEHLLRQWGRDRADDEVQLPPAPDPADEPAEKIEAGPPMPLTVQPVGPPELSSESADESASQAPPAPPAGGEVLAPAVAPPRWRALRIASAMAAGMLIAAGVFLGMLHSGAVEWNVGRAVAGADSAAQPQPEPEPSAEVEAPSLPPATPADTEAELASLQRQLEQARQQARQAATRLESQRDLYEQQLAAVSGPESAAAAPAEASAGRQLDEALSDAREARRRLTVTQGQLAEARKEIEELRQSVSETSTSHARQRQQLAGELAEAEKEADRLRALLARETGELRRLHEQALADVRQARRQVGRLETLLAIRSADTQRAYLNALAPGASGLARRQLAARSANLTARLPAVREQVRSQPALELMDRLEVALLKLEFLDPDREAGRRAFREFLREQSFPEAIDEQLATGTLASDARQWLVEARMILAGAERAA